MNVAAVVSANLDEAKKCGVGLGLLARADIVCERVEPADTLVDRLFLAPPPDLLLLDADLPGFFPLPAVKALRRLPSFMLTPIFVCSEIDREEEAKSAGVTQFLKKPVSEVALDEALARHVKPILRKAPRKGLKGPCIVSKGGVKLEGRISDVSILGAQVSVKDRLAVGAMVQLGFAIMMQKTPHVMRVNARVVREIPGGYGLAFSALDQEMRSLISAYAKG